MASKNPYLHFPYAPLTDEHAIPSLTVRGKIPDEISGAYYRNGPNPRFPINPHHWFDGDGMIHQIKIRGGNASYRNRHVQTKARSLENRFGKLFPGLNEIGRLRNLAKLASTPFLLRSPLKDTSNTDLICFDKKIISLWWLSGKPYSLSTDLEPLGVTKFQGYSGNMAAHARIDPKTGELFFLDFSQILPWVKVGCIKPNGPLKWLRKFMLPAPRIFHDILFTQNFVILMDFPVSCVFEPLPELGLNRRYPTRILLVPRDGKSPEICFETDPCYVLHGINAYEQDDNVYLTVCKYEDPFPKRAPAKVAKKKSVPFVGLLKVETRPFLWTLNRRSGFLHEQLLDTENTEFPRINDTYLGVKSRFSYHPKLATSHTVQFEGVIKFDWETGKKTPLLLPEGTIGEEFVFIPRASHRSEDDGWIASMVHNLEDQTSSFNIYDALSFNPEPVAVIQLPLHVPFGFHCKWVC